MASESTMSTSSYQKSNWGRREVQCRQRGEYVRQRGGVRVVLHLKSCVNQNTSAFEPTFGPTSGTQASQCLPLRPAATLPRGAGKAAKARMMAPRSAMGEISEAWESNPVPRPCELQYRFRRWCELHWHTRSPTVVVVVVIAVVVA